MPPYLKGGNLENNLKDINPTRPARPVRRNDQLIILGTAQSMARTPWDQKNKYDYWACSPVLTHEVSDGKYIDAFFEMHTRSTWQRIKDFLNDYVKKINPNVIIYMQRKEEEIKNSKQFPIKEIQEMVHHEKLGKYYTSTIAYMIALAIYAGYKKILMYGCHMAAEEEEYSMQRACVEAWLNYGLGVGVDYWSPGDSEVMKCSYLYGYEEEKSLLLKVMNMKPKLKMALTELEKTEKKAHDETMQQLGGCILIDKLINILKK
jgi:hypothetical protein